MTYNPGFQRQVNLFFSKYCLKMVYLYFLIISFLAVSVYISYILWYILVFLFINKLTLNYWALETLWPQPPK